MKIQNTNKIIDSLIKIMHLGSQVKACRTMFWLLTLTSVTVSAQTPQANFSHSVNWLTPLRISFTDLSAPTGEITAWSWNFGDGTPASNIANPDHLYLFAGEYLVKLTVNRGAIQNTVSKTISVTNTLNPLFTKSSAAGKPLLEVKLDGRASTGFVTEMLWVIAPSSGVTFTNGSAGSPTATVKFSTAGTYNISLRVSDGSTIKESAKQTVTIKNTPKVDFNWTSPVYVGQQVQFTDLTEFPCVSGISYTWTFPFPGSSTLPNPYYTFQSTGTWDVKLCVADACGNSECIIKKVTVLPAGSPVFASFTTSTLVIKKGQSVDFYDTSTPQAQIVGWFWHFELPPELPPDYSSAGLVDRYYNSYEEKVTHTFNSPGVYKVRLQVTHNLQFMGTFHEVLITVKETPELTPGYEVSTSNETDITLSGGYYSQLMSNNIIYVKKKFGGEESTDWQLKETYHNNVGWPGGGTVSFYDIKQKDDDLIVMKSPFGGGTTYSYQVFEGVGVNTGVQSSISGLMEIPADFFAPNSSFGRPKFDLNNDEVAVVAVEATGTYLYLIKRGKYPLNATLSCWSCTSGGNPTVVTKTKIKDSAATLGKVYLDDRAVVAHVDNEIIIYEKNDAVWNFATQKKITGSFRSIAYKGNVIMTTPTACIPAGSAVAHVRERQPTGWVDNQLPTASLFIDDDEIIPTLTAICSPDINSLEISDKIAVIKVKLTANGKDVYRKFVYRQWDDFWVNSNQTYKIVTVAMVDKSSETSDVDCVNRYGNLVQIINFHNYCMLDPYVKESFSLAAPQFDVIKGIIELGGGVSPALFNSGAKAKYYGRNITLKPAVWLKPGAKVSFTAIKNCDQLYYR